MAGKVAASILAAGLLIAFLSPVVVKLKDGALTAVALVGVVMMLVDLWQSLRSNNDG